MSSTSEYIYKCHLAQFDQFSAVTVEVFALLLTISDSNKINALLIKDLATDICERSLIQSGGTQEQGH